MAEKVMRTTDLQVQHRLNWWKKRKSFINSGKYNI